MYDNGQEFKMICLSGTIPMPYKGNTYNIPVNIWIHNDYPNQAPIVLVTPTREMQIKPSKIVDSNGRVYLPYLHEWKARHVCSVFWVYRFPITMMCPHSPDQLLTLLRIYVPQLVITYRIF